MPEWLRNRQHLADVLVQEPAEKVRRLGDRVLLLGGAGHHPIHLLEGVGHDPADIELQQADACNDLAGDPQTGEKVDANAMSLVPHRPELVPYVLDPPVEPRLDPIDNAGRSQVSEVDVARVPGVVEELLSDPVSVGGVGAGGQFRLDFKHSKNRSVCAVVREKIEQTTVSSRYLDGSPT